MGLDIILACLVFWLRIWKKNSIIKIKKKVGNK